MVDEKQLSSDVLTWSETYCTKPLQIPIDGRDDDEDVDDNDIGEEMNKQVHLEDLNLVKTRLNYN